MPLWINLSLSLVCVFLFSCAPTAQIPKIPASDPGSKILTAQANATGNRTMQDSAVCSAAHLASAADVTRTTGPSVFVIEVGIDGSVKDVSIARSSGSALLDKAAVDCAKAHWRFRPALKDGKPVEASVKYAIKWRMEPPPR